MTKTPAVMLTMNVQMLAGLDMTRALKLQTQH